MKLKSLIELILLQGDKLSSLEVGRVIFLADCHYLENIGHRLIKEKWKLNEYGLPFMVNISELFSENKAFSSHEVENCYGRISVKYSLIGKCKIYVGLSEVSSVNYALDELKRLNYKECTRLIQRMTVKRLKRRTCEILM